MTVRPRSCADIRAKLHEERSQRLTRVARLSVVISAGRDDYGYRAIEREYADGVVMGLDIALRLFSQINA